MACTSFGKGVKRKSKPAKNPKKPKVGKIEIDVCDALEAMSISRIPLPAVKVDLTSVSNLITTLELLRICECKNTDSFTCTAQDLMQLGDGFVDVHMSSPKHDLMHQPISNNKAYALDSASQQTGSQQVSSIRVVSQECIGENVSFVSKSSQNTEPHNVPLNVVDRGENDVDSSSQSQESRKVSLLMENCGENDRGTSSQRRESHRVSLRNDGLCENAESSSSQF